MKIILISLWALLILNSCNISTKNNTHTQDTNRNLIQNAIIADSTSLHNNLSPKELDSINTSNEAMIDYENKERLGKAYISTRDSNILAGGNINSDYRIFGYQQPNIHSKKMILISVFTTDVEGNPFQCPYGATYSLRGMDSIGLKYIASENAFISASVITNKKSIDTVFIEKRWTEIDDL